MAETRIIGAVAVKVRPVTAGFRRKTKAGILKELRDMDVNVEVKIDADIDGLMRKLRNLDGKKVKVDVEVDTDVDKAAEKVDKTLGDLEKKQSKRTIKFNADRESIRKAISEVQAELDKLTAEKLKVELNKDGLNAALDQLTKRLADEPLRLRYVNDNDGLNAAIKQIDAELAKFRETEISVHVDEESLRDARERLLSELNQEPIELKIDYSDIESLRKAKKQLDAELAEFSKVAVEIDADEESIKKFSNKIQDLIDKAERDTVDLEVDVFTADAAAALKYASRTRFVDFFVRVNKRSVAVAEGVLKSIAGWNVISKTGRALEDLVTNFDKIAVKGGLWSAAIGGIADSFSYLLSSTLTVGNGVLDAIGTLAMLPALLSTMAAVIAINIAAWDGFADAVNGNNKALADLPPNAQKAARSLRGAWTQIQKPVQRRFWDGMGDEFSKLADVIIPQFRDGLTDAAFHVGEFGRGVAKAFRKIALNGDLKHMFAGLEGFFNNLAGSAEPFIDALNRLGLRGSEYLPRFGQWLTDISIQFDNFVRKADDAGDINRWIEEGVESFQDMGRVIGGTTDMLQGFTQAAYDAGHGGLSEFANTMQRIGDIVEGEPFRSRMTRIFKGANDGATELNKGVRDLGDTFMSSADNVGTMLESLGLLGGVTLSGLSKSFANLKFQTGLQDAVDGLTQGIKDMGPAFDAAGSIVGHFGSLAGEVFKGLSPLFNVMAGALADMVNELAPEVEDLAGTLSGTLQGVIEAIIPPVRTLATMLGNALETFSSMPGPIKTAVVVLGGIAPMAISAYKAIKALSPFVGTASAMFGELGKKAPRAARGLGAVAKTGAGLGLVGGALTILGTALTKLDPTRPEDVAKALNDVAQKRDFTSLDALFSQWDRMAVDTSAGMRGLNDAINEVANPPTGSGLNEWADKTFAWTGLAQSSLTQAKEKLALVGDELGNMVRNGNGPAAAEIFKQLADRFKASGKNAGDAAKAVPGYTDALNAIAREAGVAVNETDLLAWAMSGIPPAAVDAAQGAKRVEDSLDAVGISADGTVDDLERFVDALFDAGLKTLDSRDAAFRYSEQLDSVKEAAKEIAKGELGNALNKTKDDFNKTTEAGRLANEEFSRLARDGMAGVERKAKEGVGQKELQKDLQKTYEDLVAAARGFGIGEEGAKNLAREVLGVPDGVDIKTWMDSFAKDEAERLKKQVDELPGYKEVLVAVTERGTTGEVQSKIDEVTGKEEYVFVTTGGTTVEVQKEIREIDGVDRTVYVSDDGTIISTQENIDSLKGKKVTAEVEDKGSDVVKTMQGNINGLKGKTIQAIAQFVAKNYPELKERFDSIKEKTSEVTADFISKHFPGVKDAYDSIKHKDVDVWAVFKNWFFGDKKKEYDSIDDKEVDVWTVFKNWFFGKNKGEYDSVKDKDVDVWTVFKNWFFGSKKGEYDSMKDKNVDVWTVFTNWFFGSKKRDYDSMRDKNVDVEARYSSWNWDNTWNRFRSLKDKIVDVTTNFFTKYFGNGGFNAMDGGLSGSGSLSLAKGLPKTRAFKQFADGGIESHTAQIARSTPSSPIRIWAEPETGGEAYIPLSPSKRQRSMAIWRETGKRLGANFYEDGDVIGGGAGRGGPTFNINNHYPQAEPTSVTINRGMQLAGMPGLSDDF